MKKILIRSGKSPFEAVSVEQVMQQRIGGANVGNLVFSDSAHKMLLTGDTEVTSTRFSVGPKDAARINETYDVFVMPFANAFRPQFAAGLKMWTELIEKLTIPVVVLGAGAQSTLDYDLEPLRPVDDAVKRFAKAVLDRSPSIGVRGEFTERYLNSLGFSDVEVIGCPSMFRNGDILDVQKRLPALDRDSRLAVSVTAGPVGDIARTVSANYERYPDLLYVAQDLTDVETLYWGDTSESTGRTAPLPRLRTHPLFRDNRVRVFLDPQTWIDALSERDFAFGTRIHGNITALLGGTPSVVLCHDSRTLELSRYFDIPHRLLSDLPPDVDAADLYAEADYSALLNGHRERFDRMMSFLRAHGLDNVYEAGDKGEAFEARMRETSFSPGIEAWTGADDGGLGYRIGWLKANVRRLGDRQAKADKRIEALTKQVAALEKAVERSQAGTYRKVRRAVGRPVRRMLKGRG